MPRFFQRRATAAAIRRSPRVPLRERQVRGILAHVGRRRWLRLRAFVSPTSTHAEQPHGDEPEDGDSDVERSGAEHMESLAESERGAASPASGMIGLAPFWESQRLCGGSL
jgi:hypothetical protein